MLVVRAFSKRIRLFQFKNRLCAEKPRFLSNENPSRDESKDPHVCYVSSNRELVSRHIKISGRLFLVSSIFFIFIAFNTVKRDEPWKASVLLAAKVIFQITFLCFGILFKKLLNHVTKFIAPIDKNYVLLERMNFMGKPVYYRRKFGDFSLRNINTGIAYREQHHKYLIIPEDPAMVAFTNFYSNSK
ncbi:hypothetical protein RF11_14814 [Thelohanellus kitauei]|uniref:Uncharacterized protein n=1 Tax=Thelohanellus kitauei TaxID=669202 RepID=A0A0C2MB14_THEKT|nr:hypothetical protein RF11_14814 [Thelohanellus kitauei]